MVLHCMSIYIAWGLEKFYSCDYAYMYLLHNYGVTDPSYNSLIVLKTLLVQLSNSLQTLRINDSGDGYAILDTV